MTVAIGSGLRSATSLTKAPSPLLSLTTRNRTPANVASGSAATVSLKPSDFAACADGLTVAILVTVTATRATLAAILQLPRNLLVSASTPTGMSAINGATAITK